MISVIFMARLAMCFEIESVWVCACVSCLVCVRRGRGACGVACGRGPGGTQGTRVGDEKRAGENGKIRKKRAGSRADTKPTRECIEPTAV